MSVPFEWGVPCALKRGVKIQQEVLVLKFIAVRRPLGVFATER